MPEAMIAMCYVGVLLVLCLFMGRIVSHCRIPKVTGYLLAGILVNPSALSFVFEALGKNLLGALDHLRFISDLALGLIAFSIGGEFQNERFKKMGKKVLTISLCETTVTFCIVFSTLFFFTTNLSLASCLGILAIATAPAATLLVLREYDSEGAVTSSLLILTGLNNFICLVVFSLFVPTIIAPATGASSGSGNMVLLFSLGSVVIALMVGFLLGFLLSLFEKHITKPAERVVLIFATIVLGIGLSQIIGVSPLLVNLITGATVINLARNGHRFLEELKKIDLPLYAAFFALSGANLHWELLSATGGVGVIYCAGRITGKILGVTVGALRARASYNLKKYGGCGLLSQAGVALGLALIVEDMNENIGEIVSTTILSTVIFFEILGPIAVRWSVVKSGEVKIINLIHRDEGTPFRESLKDLVCRLRTALGMPVWKSRCFTGEVCVEHIMRTHIEIIHEETHFDQILKIIEHTRYNLFPVVNEEGAYTGVISFQDIRDVLYDGIMENLVIAKDIANPARPVIHSKATITDALALFEREKVDILPVIDNRETNHLMGIVTQRDVLTAFKGGKRGG